VNALVGTAGHSTTICDECLDLCWDIIGHGVGIQSPQDGHRYVQPSFEDEAFQQRVGEILQRLAAEREASRSDALLNDLRRSLDTDRRASLEQFRCSFCGADSRDVAKMISGPRVYICDTCIGEATAVVSHVLRMA